MKALVDIDDVLTPTQEALLEYVNARSSRHYAYAEVNREMREHEVGEYDDFVGEYLKQPDLVHALKPFSHSEIALRELHDAGYEVHICSSRKEGLHAVTSPWLEEHGLLQYVYQIHGRPATSDGADFKCEVALEIGADVAFDDTQSVIEQLASNGVLVYAIDSPWNVGELDAPADKVRRAPDIAAAVHDLLRGA